MSGRSGGSIQSIELDLFIEAVARRYGYDFRNYARASLKRRVGALATKLGCPSIADLLPLVLRGDLLTDILTSLSVPVTSMFRDPPVFEAIAAKVLPLLADLPEITIWQAGCATGEEVYSLAILLEEAGLLARTRIYATDINEVVLDKARGGVFPAKMIEEMKSQYRQAGGRRELDAYFSVTGKMARVGGGLKDHIVFASHNLVSDGVFCEAQMVVCRNVLIYFDRHLQDRVLKVFQSSLSDGGFLCLGGKENILFSAVAPQFVPVEAALRLYRKRDPTV